MSMKHFVYLLSMLTLFILAGLSFVLAADKGQVKLTKIEQLIFDTPHMVNVPPGQTLYYQFERKSSLGDAYSDRIELIISQGEEVGNRSVAFEFFTGQRKRPYPPLSYVTSNPLLTIYFNKDAWDLSRRIKAKGVVNYLRNRILDAVGQVREVEQTTCSYNGKQLPAQKISFEPFIKDENRHHLVHYAAIRYEITLAKDIPGEVCQIQSIVPYPSEKVPEHFIRKIKKSGMLSLAQVAQKGNEMGKTQTPLIVETMRFEKMEPTKQAAAD